MDETLEPLRSTTVAFVPGRARWSTSSPPGVRPPESRSVGSTWWAPHDVAWWTGCLFAVGSICFALGALPGYVDAVGLGADGVTFFVGSLFFTTAALLSLIQVWDSRPRAHEGRAFPRLAWATAGAAWWACAVQFVGTLFFNRSTFDAMLENLSQSQANQLVWRPDVLGSICFLVASWIAWKAVAHRLWSWQPRSLTWWIAGLNLAGSIAFGASAAAAHVVSRSGQVRNVAVMNLGTFLGALAFLAGAVLLLPARTATTTDL